MDFIPLKRLLVNLSGDMLPGGVVCVFRDGKHVFEFHTGYADEENGIELTGDELYSAYSMTKPLTAVCALIAVERGLMRLDTPLEALLPDFVSLSVAEAYASGQTLRPCRIKPTIAHLLTMSAGFGESMNELGRGDTFSAVSSLARKPLLFEPGEHWVYGLCYEVLGAALESCFGMKLRSIFKREIFDRCSMNRSCFLSEINDYNRIVPMYRAVHQTYEPMALDLTYAPNKDYDSGGAGLVTSAEDYERFLIALTQNRLISTDSLALIIKNRLTGEMLRDFNWPQTSGYGYGLGVRTPLPGRTRDFGWGGAAGAYWLYDDELHAGMCFFTNVLNANEAVLYPALRKAFYDSFV
ncbi:MAG: beta-lactamase family protein [Clostridia bacterium]|nr:beta-lactamase family protein [Clostridia bacterium]